MSIAAPHPPIHIWTRRLSLAHGGGPLDLGPKPVTRHLDCPVRLVGVMDEAGLRVPSHVRGEGFVVDLWLENDGDPATQPEAAAQPLWQAEGAGQAATVKGYRVWHGWGEAALTDALSACGAADVVILAARLNPSDSPGPCLFFDASDMAREGAVALHLPQGGIGPITIETSRASQGARLWSGRSR